MNGEKLLESMNLIDLSYVEEAADIAENGHRKIWGYYAGLAASIAVCFISGVLSIAINHGTSGDNSAGGISYIASIFGESGGPAALFLVVLSLLAFLTAIVMIYFIRHNRRQ